MEHIKEHTIKVKNLDIFYTEEGQGEPVIILHGWSSSTSAWQRVQHYLASRGFRVIVPDLPGFGKSQEPDNPWALDDYVEFVKEFAQKLDIGYFTLAGHSFGGRIAIYYASEKPKQLRALVLISAAGVVRHKKIKIRLFKIFTHIGNKILKLPGLHLLKQPLEKLWYKMTGETDYRLATPVMKQTMSRALEKELYSYLPVISAPTLILWGEKDKATPIGDAFRIHKSIPLTHLHIFPDMPHALNLKAPKEVAKQIALFLGLRK